MGLFLLPASSDVGAVGPVFLPDGRQLLANIKGILREQQKLLQFQEVATPSLAQTGLWRRSGHWTHYRANMWTIEASLREDGKEELGDDSDVGGEAAGGRLESEEIHSQKTGERDTGEETDEERDEERNEERGDERERRRREDDIFRLSLKPMSCPFHLAYVLPFLLETPSLFSPAFSPSLDASTLPSAAVSASEAAGAAEIEEESAESEVSRHLPLRISEFGRVFRRERRSALCGLFRLREFTQDDGHILCTRSQAVGEITSQLSSILQLYFRVFGIAPELIKVSLGTRPAKASTLPAGAADSANAALWREAESWLLDAAARVLPENFKVEREEGGGAFYGPKLDFSLPDARGRRWQTGTIQVDLLQPPGLERVFSRRHSTLYPSPPSSSSSPSSSSRSPASFSRSPSSPSSLPSSCLPLVLIHRAAVGSLERFLALLLELRNGELPLWIAPVKAAVCPVSVHSRESQHYAQKVARLLRRSLDSSGAFEKEEIEERGEQASTSGVLVDLRPLHLNTKLKDLLGRRRIPLLFLVGPREEKTEGVTVLTQAWRTSSEDGKKDGERGQFLSLNEAVRFFRELAQPEMPITTPSSLETGLREGTREQRETEV
ncbi:putative threonyl-tRNA synthetase [Neospora caninum Liverpool]|nr:putative threonyl-tRNA synthetase [Neospora caninum Liverpool]CBZ55690.1 putative threonyl-tRNA synthetase [Neospora caninum Liverpool]|eukprot:XP_003885716.1 putative threonyl-tRNA synthetase [Neospora caninum Liverpool]